MLEPDDFALSSGEEPPPSDLVDHDTWRGLTALPDDVSIRTSNHHGSDLKVQYDLWGAWIDVVGAIHDSLYVAILDAADELQAATFNALTGYYRQGFACLRSFLEQLAVGAYYQLLNDVGAYTQWRSGRVEKKFGAACDSLAHAPASRSINHHLLAVLQDSLFNQRTPSQAGGWARRLYDELSDYAHARPGLSSGDIWESNGPIYVEGIITRFAAMSVQTCALGFVLVKLGRPHQEVPRKALGALQLPVVQGLPIARTALEYLWPALKLAT